MATSMNAISHALNPHLPYDIAKEFQPISLIANAGQVLVVHPSLLARSVRDFIALAKARPGQLTYSSSGAGTSGHLAMEALSSAAKIKLLHVPYKGNAPALNDLLGGQRNAGEVAELWARSLAAALDQRFRGFFADRYAALVETRQRSAPDFVTIYNRRSHPLFGQRHTRYTLRISLL